MIGKKKNFTYFTLAKVNILKTIFFRKYRWENRLQTFLWFWHLIRSWAIKTNLKFRLLHQTTSSCNWLRRAHENQKTSIFAGDFNKVLKSLTCLFYFLMAELWLFKLRVDTFCCFHLHRWNNFLGSSKAQMNIELGLHRLNFWSQWQDKPHSHHLSQKLRALSFSLTMVQATSHLSTLCLHCLRMLDARRALEVLETLS